MKKQEIGLIGLGVMGRNFILNMAEKGFSVSGYDIDKDKVSKMKSSNEDFDILTFTSLDDFIASLMKPAKVMLLVPAGVVDNVLDELVPHLEEGSIIIDGGNSHPLDTLRRMKKAEEERIDFIGMGISGGSYGARFGPSMMPGGKPEAYDKVKHIFEATAAEADGEKCVRYLGKDHAGHFVKMVHNGIEYGIMQLISEVYDILKNGLGLNNQELQEVFLDWNKTSLNSYLLEITANIFAQKDDKGEGYIIDHILDSAKQKGTGKWASQMALDLGVPIPTIDVAVSMRNMSAFKSDRVRAEAILSGEEHKIHSGAGRDKVISKLKNSFYFGMMVTYAQGFELMQSASEEYDFGLNLSDIATIWRGGCIIRSAMLENIKEAYHKHQSLANLLFDDRFIFQEELNNDELREVILMAIASSIPVPGFMSVIGYFDAFRSGKLPMNLIQAQRDYFGGHTYQRIDDEGVFHTKWQNKE